MKITESYKSKILDRLEKTKKFDDKCQIELDYIFGSLQKDIDNVLSKLKFEDIPSVEYNYRLYIIRSCSILEGQIFNFYKILTILNESFRLFSFSREYFLRGDHYHIKENGEINKKRWYSLVSG